MLGAGGSQGSWAGQRQEVAKSRKDTGLAVLMKIDEPLDAIVVLMFTRTALEGLR